jgi:hypothetical protein
MRTNVERARHLFTIEISAGLENDEVDEYVVIWRRVKVVERTMSLFVG